MSALPTFQNFLQRRDGTSTLEFVVIFGGFIAIVFFVMEVTLYLFFMATLEKAAESGARVAVTSRPVVNFARTIEVAPGARFGDSCNQGGGGACVPFSSTPLTCTGAACGASAPADCRNPNTSFDRILCHMRGFNARIQPENVTIAYADVGIGFAGGPTVPMVTVTVHDVPFQTGILGLLLASGANNEATLLATLPTRSASMTGEDLAQ